MIRFTRFWWALAGACWLLSHTQLVMAAVEEVPMLRAQVSDLRKRLDSYDRAWASLARARDKGRHLRSVPARDREAG